MKLKNTIANMSIFVLVFLSFSLVVGCYSNQKANEQNSNQEEIYNLYIQYMNAKGEASLTYEEWLNYIKGEAGETPVITIVENGNWFVDGVDTQVKAQGDKGEAGDTPTITVDDSGYLYINGENTGLLVECSIPSYMVKYYYNLPFEVEFMFDNYKDEEKVFASTWLESMPAPKSEIASSFDGWYIKGTNKKIGNYDFIGGDVTLVAKWNDIPNVHGGLYSDNELVLSWEELRQKYPTTFKENSIGSINEIEDKELLSGHLVLDESVEIIEDFAFENASYLESVTLTSNVKRIGDNAFYGCSNLKKINLPESLEYIGTFAFAYTSLESISIPSKIKNLETGLFYNVESLKSITLNEGLVKIGGHVFFKCYNLGPELILPKALEEINTSAFVRCWNLMNIRVDADNQYFSEVGGVLFNKDVTTMIWYPQGRQDEIYVIPDGVINIRAGTFSEAVLKKIIIPKTLEYLPTSIFTSCYQLKSIIVDEDNPYFSTIYSDALDMLADKSGTELIFVPLATVDELNIPSQVKVIRNSAFTKSKVKRLYIPTTIESIETLAFSGADFDEVIINNQNIANTLIEPKSWGEILLSTNKVYIRSNLSVEDSTYLLENFTKTDSDILEYDLYKEFLIDVCTMVNI